MDTISLDRRDMFKGLLAISAAGALAACGAANAPNEGAAEPAEGDAVGFFNQRQDEVKRREQDHRQTAHEEGRTISRIGASEV